MGPIVIVGNNLAALVAARELGERGRPVTLVNPGRGWGGYFAGMEMDGKLFDPGMVLYEFDSFYAEPNPDVLSYDARQRGDCGRFASRVRDYVGSRVATRAVSSPQMWVQGRLYPDMIIANHVGALALFPDSLRNRIRRELAEIVGKQSNVLHASHKRLDAARFLEIDFAAVSAANHGKTLHDVLLEPICRKILGVSGSRLPALYHRVGWLPLYYPETLLSQFGPSPQRLPETRFHYPIKGSASEIVRVLVGEIHCMRNVTVLNTPLSGLDDTGRMRFPDGSSFEASEVVWTLDPGALIAMADPAGAKPDFERASIGLAFFVVPAKKMGLAFSTIFVTDPAYSIYRITDQEICAGGDGAEHRIIAEFDMRAMAGLGATEPAARRAVLLAELVRLGVVAGPDLVAYSSEKLLDRALMLPSSANMKAFEGQLKWLGEHLPRVRLTGASAGFLTASMNDQVVQGLKLATELGEAV